MPISVFIENAAGASVKNLYDEKTLQFLRAVDVACPYPYPYGFVLDTISGDGDNLDCHVITAKALRPGQTVECIVLGMMEQIEDQREDHKILAALEGEDARITVEVKQTLVDFSQRVFADIAGKQLTVGGFHGARAAIDLIRRCRNRTP